MLLEDLSEGGLRLISPEPFAVSSRLLIDLDIDGVLPPIRTVAQVTWLEQARFPDCWQLGVQFTDLTSSLRNSLHHAMWNQAIPG